MKTALITGITGQDGSYLAELLLEKGYQVHGLARRSSVSNLQRIQHLVDQEQLKNQFIIHEGDLCDGSFLKKLIDSVQPDEVYNMAAMSHVKTSFSIPEYTAEVDGLGVLKLLEAIRLHGPTARFYQASTSELFGKVQQVPQNEATPFYPRSPYGVAKLFAYWTVINYREAYNLFACNGILFNHESPRRGDNFVSKKITKAVAKIAKGLQDTLTLGNLDAKRDWGYAKDYVEGMWLMLQQDQPDDYVLATGNTTTVREFVELAFLHIGITIIWENSGIHEKGLDSKTRKVLVEISPEFFRPSEVELLIGDAAKAKEKFGWMPKTCLKELVFLMMESDLQELENFSHKSLLNLQSC